MNWQNYMSDYISDEAAIEVDNIIKRLAKIESDYRDVLYHFQNNNKVMLDDVFLD